MASAWGVSWGSSWAGSWGTVAAEEIPVVTSSGGTPWYPTRGTEWADKTEQRKERDEARSRYKQYADRRLDALRRRTVQTLSGRGLLDAGIRTGVLEIVDAQLIAITPADPIADRAFRDAVLLRIMQLAQELALEAIMLDDEEATFLLFAAV